MPQKGTRGGWRTEAPQGYRLVSSIAEEPLWTLAVAEHRDGERVLLKLFSPLVQSQESLRAEVLASLRASKELGHPQILQPLSLSEEGGLVVAVYAHRSGKTLRDRLHGGKPVGVGEACRTVLQLAMAIQYLHQQGLVQGLLTPASVCLDEEGRPLLHEVALVRLAALIFERGAPNIRHRYAPYVAPELLQPEGQATLLSDVYALGILLYELLTARPPFAGDTVQEIVEQQLHGIAPAASPLNPRVPQGLDLLVGRCLEKDPRKRFPSCGALMDALEAELLRLPQEEARPRRPKVKRVRLPGTVTDRPKAWLLVVGTILMVGLGGGGAFLLLREREQAPVAKTQATEEQAVSILNKQGAVLAPPAQESAPAAASKASGAPAARTVPMTVAQPMPAGVMLQAQVDGVPVRADVLVDGTRAGSTDSRGYAALRLLPEKRHSLRVMREGYLPWDTTLVLAAGQGQTLLVGLSPEPGSTAEVTFAPVGFAELLRIDDVGEARPLPATLALPIGRHVVEYLDREGNPMWRGEQLFDSETPRPYVPPVVVKFGELAVVVENASEVGYGYVLIDGQEWKSGGTSATPMRTLVPGGQHRVRLVRDGFRAVPTDTTVVVQPGQQLRLGFRLYAVR
ncbi:MAG: serine/threonine protein kinase [Candidatus Oleimicrobiaceae bacterium]